MAIRPNFFSAGMSMKYGRMSAECGQEPTNVWSGAAGFRRRSLRTSAPDWSADLTTRSVVLHQSWSGTPELAIARA